MYEGTKPPDLAGRKRTKSHPASLDNTISPEIFKPETTTPQRCDHVSIQNNEVWNGGATAAGIFLHRSSDSAIVKGNHIYDMNVCAWKTFGRIRGVSVTAL